MNLDTQLRQQLTDLLNGGNAHMPLSEAVAGFPEDKINHRPEHVDYTYWHLIEHLRITQRDILNYLTDPNYHEPSWPKDYWPALDATTDRAGWDATIATFQDDVAQLVAIVNDPGTDLAGPVPNHPEHTILREILVVTDHNAYHIGELGILRQVDGTWGPSHVG
jgi:hypothetical protein